MQDELSEFVSRPVVPDLERNVPRPDFHRIIYIYRAAAYVQWDGESIWVPAGWLVIDRLDSDVG